MEKTIVRVTFKESYMPHPVTRECVNMSRAEVIEVYGLMGPDIEWFKFED